jgi:hypothetical protein
MGNKRDFSRHQNLTCTCEKKLKILSKHLIHRHNSFELTATPENNSKPDLTFNFHEHSEMF